MADASLLVLYQAEWCPHSRRVRERLTELGVDFVARQVPARPEDRGEMRQATGVDEIPTAVFAGGRPVSGDDAILEALDARFEEPEGADEHRRQARAHA